MVNRLQIGSSDSVTFRSKPGLNWVSGGAWIFCGLLLVVQSLVIMDGGRLYGLVEVAPDRAFLTGLGCLVGAYVLIVRGALMWVRQWRGTYGLTVTAIGIRLVSSAGAKRADWSSLTDFAVSRQSTSKTREKVCAMAGIVGPAVSRSLRGRGAFVIQDMFPQPIATVVEELNDLRPQCPANDAAAGMPIAAGPPSASPFQISKGLIIIVGVAVLVNTCRTGFRDWDNVLNLVVQLLIVASLSRTGFSQKSR
jgi:hypothetical protein